MQRETSRKSINECLIGASPSVQVIDDLERNNFTRMRKYTATDITAAFGPGLLQSVRNSALDFQASAGSCLYPICYSLAADMQAVLGSVDLVQL
jgi:hypothetical protein